jgi:methionyl-tRNA formyltransferase
LTTVFLGTTDFAATVLERLSAGPHRPALVVTRPDRPRGRGRRLAAPPVAEAGRALGLDVFQPERVNEPDAVERIAAAAPRTVCVCAFGALIREPLLSTWPMLNVHPSLLPRWRGAAPLERAIMAGDERTGVSIMRLTAGLDSGPVALQQPEPIRRDDDYGTLAERLAVLGGELLVRALDEQPPPREQDDAQATYAEKIEPADRWLRPDRPAIELARRVRALEPHIGARLGLDSERALRVRRAAVMDPVTDTDLAPGRLVARGGRLLLGCASGTLELRAVQPSGGREMDTAAYLRGHPELPERVA